MTADNGQHMSISYAQHHRATILILKIILVIYVIILQDTLARSHQMHTKIPSYLGYKSTSSQLLQMCLTAWGQLLSHSLKIVVTSLLIWHQMSAVWVKKVQIGAKISQKGTTILLSTTLHTANFTKYKSIFLNSLICKDLTARKLFLVC